MNKVQIGIIFTLTATCFFRLELEFLYAAMSVHFGAHSMHRIRKLFFFTSWSENIDLT